MGEDGIPLCLQVLPGNNVDKRTVVEVVRDLKTNFKLRRVAFVRDRGGALKHDLGQKKDLGFTPKSFIFTGARKEN